MLSDGQLVDGKYRIGRQLGEGGMGAVYEATEVASGAPVAIKVVLVEHAKDKTQLARFEREARASGTIGSMHVAKLLDAGVDAETGRPYLAMERLQGEDVQQLVRRLGPFPPNLALRIAAQACVGLAKAHESDIIHRDIKSANVFVASHGEGPGAGWIVKVLDFGVAKIRRSPSDLQASKSLTQTGGLIGSPLYMSPEQAIGSKSFDARSDIFSLGVVLYEMLTGRVPHEAHDTLGRLIIAICQEPAAHVQSLAPWVPGPIAAIVHKALEIDPGDRYSSAFAMLDAIGEVLDEGWEISGPDLRGLTAGERQEQAPRVELPRAHSVSGASARTPGDADVALTRTDNGHDTTVRTERRPLAGRLLAAGLGGVVLVAGIVLVTRPASHGAPPTVMATAPTAAPTNVANVGPPPTPDPLPPAVTTAPAAPAASIAPPPAAKPALRPAGAHPIAAKPAGSEPKAGAPTQKPPAPEPTRKLGTSDQFE